LNNPISFDKNPFLELSGEEFSQRREDAEFAEEEEDGALLTEELSQRREDAEEEDEIGAVLAYFFL